jgi:hypothetical protein
MFKKYLLKDSRPVKARYKYPFLFFPFIFMMASFLALHVAVVGLASIWHISMNTPGRGQPHILPFCALVLIIMLIFTLLGFLLGLIVDSLLLYFIYGWSFMMIKKLVLEAEAPDHWYRD